MDSPAERDTVERFLRRLTKGAPLTLCGKPDAPGKPSRPGGSPDYVYEDPSGQRYVVEATRVLNPETRALESFLKRHVCERLASVVQGRWVLEYEMETFSERRPSKHEAADWVATIEHQSGQSGGMLTLGPGVTARRVGTEGTGVVPWIEAPRLPVRLSEADALRFQTHVSGILTEAATKFAGYEGQRLLLIDISQAGLDWEFHVLPSRDGPGPVLTWVQSVPPSNLDAVYLDTGVRVWHPPSMRRVVSGHRFIDKATAFYIRVWPGVRIL